jgi:hypothetical protein
VLARRVQVAGFQAGQGERAAGLEVVRVPVHAGREVVARAGRVAVPGGREAVVEQPRRVRPDPGVAARGGLGEFGLRS